MTRQVLDTGSAANDGTGDTLRQAAQKINENFVEVYQYLGGDSDVLASRVTLEDSAIAFEGATADDFEIRLAADNATADRIARLPDADGFIVLDTATQTLTNKTLTAATLSTPIVTTSINDTNDNELIKVTATGSAVNEITITNAATGNKPTISATGTDTNISLNLIPKGSSAVTLGKAAYNSVTVSTNGTVPATTSYIICNKGSALALALDSGDVVGEFKYFTNKGAGVATVTPTAFAQGSTFALPQYSAAQAIWDGTNWYLLGVDSDLTIS